MNFKELLDAMGASQIGFRKPNKDKSVRFAKSYISKDGELKDFTATEGKKTLPLCVGLHDEVYEALVNNDEVDFTIVKASPYKREAETEDGTKFSFYLKYIIIDDTEWLSGD